MSRTTDIRIAITVDQPGGGHFGAKTGQALDLADAFRRAGLDARLVEVNHELLDRRRWPASTLFVCAAEAFSAGQGVMRYAGPFGVRRALRDRGLAFLGSSDTACGASSSGDKRRARRGLAGIVEIPNGLDFDAGCDIDEAARRIASELGLPVVLKQATQTGCSQGVYWAEDLAELLQGLQALNKVPLVAESFIPGTELTVWLVQTKGGVMSALGSLEIERPLGMPILSRAAKRLTRPSVPLHRGLAPDVPELHAPPRIAAALLRLAEAEALQAAAALGLQGYARVDLIVQQGRAVVIDVNATPHLGAADLGWAAAAGGSSHEVVLNALVAAHLS